LIAKSCVQLACLGVIALQVWSILCSTPFYEWNSARLIEAALVGSAHTIYFLPNTGPALGWIYGPVWPLLLAPATWLPDITTAMIGAASINCLLLLGPLILVVSDAAVQAKADPVTRRWLILFCMSGAICTPWIAAQLRFIHVDAPAVGLALLSCWFLSKSEPRAANQWLAATLLVLAVWSKQISVGVVAAQLFWLLTRRGTRPTLRYLVRFCVVGLAVTGLFIALFGAKELWHTLWAFPSHQRLRGGPEIFVGGSLSLLLTCLPFVLILLLAGNGKSDGIFLLLFAAGAMAPLGLLASSKIGGGPNSFFSVYYLMAAAGGSLATTEKRIGVWLRRNLARCTVAGVIAGAAWTRERDGSHFQPSSNLEASLQLAQSLKGAVYFPENPFVTWWSERKVYHLEYGYLEQMTDGFSPDPQRTAAWLPKQLKYVVYRDIARERAMIRILPGFDRSVTLPAFVVYLADPAIAKGLPPKS
jgi:hypothetical protein